MVREVLDILNPKPNETYVDCTLGAGGHTKAILDRSNCKVIGIDSFGESAPGSELLEHFGFNTENVVISAKSLLND